MLGTMPILYILLNVYGAYLRQLSKHNKILDGISTGIAGEVSLTFYILNIYQIYK